MLRNHRHEGQHQAHSLTPFVGLSLEQFINGDTDLLSALQCGMQRFGSTHFEDYELKHAFGPSGSGLLVLRQVSNLTVQPEFLDPVSTLKVHQPISHAQKSLCVVTVPFPSQVLAEHGGERAKVVIYRNMKFDPFLVHGTTGMKAGA